MDWLWDAWYYFIRYGIWTIFGLEFLLKYFMLNSIKTNLGKDYKTYPDLSNLPRWRKFVITALLFTTIAMIVMALVKDISPFYALPVIIIAGVVFINGRLKRYAYEFYTTLFFGEKGFSVYPGKFKLFSARIYSWENVEKVTIKPGRIYSEIEVNIRDAIKPVRIRANNKIDITNYTEIFKEFVAGMA
ncbi:hypothetical protein ACFLSQ_09270 [Bacteroidota bacterium]